MLWTIDDLLPGLTRHDVLDRKGPPLSDAAHGRLPLALPFEMPPTERRTVWNYRHSAVVFRDDLVVQVVGNRVEQDGRPLAGVSGPAANLYRRKEPFLTPRGSAAFHYRLLPPRLPPPEPRGLLLRGRLEQILGGLRNGRTPDEDVNAHGQWSQANQRLVEDWLVAGRFTDLALRRALWECLEFGLDYWRAADHGPHRYGHIHGTRSWHAPAHQVRGRLLADAQIERARLGDRPPPVVVALDEMTERHCIEAYQRLMLVPSVTGKMPLWRNGRPTDSLRWAAAQCLLADSRACCWNYLYPGPPENSDGLRQALTETQADGVSAWHWLGGGEGNFDWSDPAQRFHLLWIPEGGRIRPYDRDRLSEIWQVAANLEAAGDRRGTWSADWCAPLPRDERERTLLREVERSPYPDRAIPFLANRLRKIALAAADWLGSTLAPDQRALALALATILQLGLRGLGFPRG